MSDKRKSSDRPRQTSIRLGAETDEAIGWLREHLQETDSLHCPVSAADVIRTAIREMLERHTSAAKKSSKKSPNRA